VNRFGIREIILAIPSISEARQIELVALCKSTKCRVRMVSPLRDMDTQPSVRDIREISVDDILFRPEVKLDKESIAEYIQHKTVLVTGGGGSIGSEICRQTAVFYPSRLVIFDIYENNAYEILMEFKRKYPWLNVSVRIGSVRDKLRVDEVMAEFSPDLVIHCAAHKHVPLMEDSPAEAIKNNVIGTYNVIRSAGEHGVKRFVQLSTDKAVNPTNVMGASKRVTELIVQDYAKHSHMQCMTVRFGNVLGSYGSVIPLFESQIRSGGRFR
jgi:FlaA1/EpsC-like NDP-sugar epimerase